MKKFIFKSLIASLALLWLSSSMGVEAQTWLWPMVGHKSGENIISQPGMHLGSEYNSTEVYVGGKEGDFVVSPVDGTISSVSLNYKKNIGYSVGGWDPNYKTWDDNIAHCGWGGGDIDLHYVTGCIGIRTADGSVVYIAGLSGKYSFVTGQKVSAGDTLGQLAYSYKGIKKPSLEISVTGVNHAAADPMKPFGLKSQFKIEPIVREDPISAEKLREDLEVLEKAVVEVYPSLGCRMTVEEFHNSMEALRQSITQPTPLVLPEPLFRFQHLLHDSHMGMLQDPFPTKPHDFYMPVLFYSWCDDTMRVMTAVKGYEQYAGKIVKSIDGMSAHDYAQKAKQYVTHYDHGVQSTVDESLAVLGRLNIFLYHDATADSKSHVVFADGEELDIPFCKMDKGLIRENTLLDGVIKWQSLNWSYSPDSIFTTRLLNDSTAYLSLKSFDLSEVKLQELLDWIGNCKAKNMIVDLRNNPGGESDNMNRLLACFALQPLNRQRGGYLFVNQQGGFKSLKNCGNHVPDEIIFGQFVQVEGKPGYYSFDSSQACISIMPDSRHRYVGRVYVLTNGSSYSAATAFPSILVRNRRGVTVGRETGSAYHYITALENADIILPNSRKTIRIPMVRIVYDTTVTSRTPWGRGLMPDYELPLSLNELQMGADGETDVMLEYAIALIAESRYLSEIDPFAEADSPQKSSRWWPWLVAGLGLVALIFVSIIIPKRRS